MDRERRAVEDLAPANTPTDAQFRLLVDSVTDYAIFLLDAAGRVTSWNAGAMRIKGYAAHEIVGRHFSLFYTAEDRAAGGPRHMLEQAAREGRATTQSWRVRKDGSRFWADVVLTAVRGPHGELSGFAKVTRDLTGQYEAQAKLQSLTRRLVQAEEAERRRIAGELHDRVGQTLSALNMNLDMVLGMLGARASAEVRRRLRDSLSLVDGTLQTIENVMADLRPPLLEEYGLGAALGWYAEEFSARTGIAVEFEDLARERRELARDAAVALFRVGQEALANIAKHAQATRALVRLEAQARAMTLVVSDDGRGFDPLAADQRASRWGMTTMKERMLAAGGMLEIESAPGKGTTLTARVPF